MPPTTVQITTETREKLSHFREYPRETYDEIIRKLMDIVAKIKSEGELSSETLDDIRESERQIARGEGISTRELLKKLGA